nr:hypothetical protein [uncultured Cohaesibacter sp.]
MPSLIKSITKTIAVMLISVLLCIWMTNEISIGWGGFLFLVLAVFVGIPMSGAESGRYWRTAIFMLAMVFFCVYTIGFMKYDPLSRAEPFAGERQASQDVTIQLSFYYQYRTRKSQLYYEAYSQNGNMYWAETGYDATSANEYHGYFIAAPDTLRDFVIEKLGSRADFPDEDMFVGQFTNDSMAVTAQNMFIMLVLFLFAGAFVLEEAYWRRKAKQVSDNRANQKAEPAPKAGHTAQNKPNSKRQGKRKSKK